jgi:multiple sugar transport system permease protein
MPRAAMNATRVDRAKARRDALSAALFLGPNIIGFVAFTAGPVIASLVISLFNWQLIKTPIFIGLANYKRMLFEDPLFFKAFANTLYFVAVYVPLNIVASISVALVLSRAWLRGAEAYRLAFFIPILTPAVAVGAVWRYIYQPGSGLVDRVLALVGTKGPTWLGDPRWALFAIMIMTVWYQLGWNMVIFIAAIKGIPQTLYEAADMDGARPWTKHLKITIPMISPAIFFGVVMTVISSFQVFDQIYIMAGFNNEIGGPMNSTRTIAIHIFDNAFKYFKMGYASACSWALFLVIFALTIVQFRIQKRWVHYDI